MSEDRITALEEQVAHLTRTVDDLSDVVARQEIALEKATRRIGLLMEREAEREAAGSGTEVIADQRPPHW
ncbi:SlyX family protein [Aliiroseovarius sp. PTFE2010]|uniref:SlyX family protein n=1 Tax=Aliiroseovarius sp. PTFE2010 TaxID=3417190 RepID=UPI003CE92916